VRTMYRLSLFLAALIFVAGAAFAEDVRPDGTLVEDGTDCTTADAHTKTDNDTDDAWNASDDCADDSCTAAADTTFVSQITFASPSDNPSITAGAQTMAVRARKCDDGQTGTPSIRIDAHCNGTLVDTGALTNIAWNSGEGTVVTEAWTFNTTDCATDGSDVEVLIFCDAASGSPGARVGCDFAAVEWRATVGGVAVTRRMVIAP